MSETQNKTQDVKMSPEMAAAHAKMIAAADEVEKVVVGKRTEVLHLLTAMLAGAHVLIEDVPGTGKTTLASTLARVTGLDFKRAQFTPDVMASDITGFHIYNRQKENFEFREGLVMCNLLLADEINRASPKTQSALLEAMEEGQITVDGISHPLPQPFLVIATQNPTGAAGTQLLPDSQMDRFIIRLSLGYPKPEDEISMVMNRQGQNPLHNLSALMTRENLVVMQNEVENTYVKETVVKYIVDLITATRNNEDILRGASPRGTLAVTSMAKAVAQLRGRDYVLPSDVHEVFPWTIAHRLILSPKAEGQGKTPKQILAEIVGRVPSPGMR